MSSSHCWSRSCYSQFWVCIFLSSPPCCIRAIRIHGGRIRRPGKLYQRVNICINPTVVWKLYSVVCSVVLFAALFIYHCLIPLLLFELFCFIRAVHNCIGLCIYIHMFIFIHVIYVLYQWLLLLLLYNCLVWFMLYIIVLFMQYFVVI